MVLVAPPGVARPKACGRSDLPMSAEAKLRDRRLVITALGVTQIFAWGSSFYLLGVLGPVVTRDTGWPYEWVIGGVSIGLLVAGLVSPRVGHLIARHGGRPVLSAGAILLSAGLLGLGAAPSLPWYLAAWSVVGVGMGAGLYDAAFSTLGGIYGAAARPAITTLTLFGGFASTVCWPLSALLVEHFGWRGACFVYAAIQIGIALPIHLLALPRRATLARESDRVAAAQVPVRLERGEFVPFCLLAAAITIGAAILSAAGQHLLPLLQARGLDLSVAVGLGAMVGPSQVGARVVEMLAGRHYHPVWTLLASVVLIAIGAFLLTFVFSVVVLALILYGAGNGIGSIARGTVPLTWFGPGRYPVLMGRLALPLLIAMAASPFIGGLAFERFGPDGILALLCGLAVINVALAVALLIAIRDKMV
jgi:hypothetical protein